MNKQAAISSGLVLLALLVAPVAFAADGTPNLGTAAVTGEDGPTRWFIDARLFEAGAGQDDWDNNTLSVGLATPVDDATDFLLGLSSVDGRGVDAINGAVREADRDVLMVAMKNRLNGANSNPAMSVTLGLDVNIGSETTGTNLQTGFAAVQDSIIPGAKLQVEWGKPGRKQFQIAGQVAWWDDTVPTTSGDIIENYGTVASIGGGVCWPISRRLTLVGDAMICVGGDNVVTDQNLLDDTTVWSAGGTYQLRDAHNTTIGAYATNSLAPTIAGSTIAASDDAVAFGLSLRRDL